MSAGKYTGRRKSSYSNDSGDLARLKRLVDNLVAGGYVTDASSKHFEASYTQFHTGTSKMIQGLTGMGQYLDGTHPTRG